MMKVAVLGFGTVGSGVVELINKNSSGIKKRSGKEIIVKKILDIRSFPDSPFSSLFVSDFEDILHDNEIDVIVETMGGVKPAYEFTRKSLEAGKHVVTSNKEMIAKYGAELLKLAKEKNLCYFFEASVGGGIPIIKPLNECLSANEISEISGILNGTTNYILTEMIKYGKSFDDALKDAQDKGYAEKDPSADVEGYDTCRKIAILSSLAFSKQVNYEDIETDGITKLTLKDVKYADALGGVIKLLGRSKKTENGIEACVSPYMLQKSHPLANVEDVFNAILIKGEMLGDVMFYGRGAGKFPTASAVVNDIIDIAKNTITRISWDEQIQPVNPISSSYFVRIKTVNVDKLRKYKLVEIEKDEVGVLVDSLEELNKYEVINIIKCEGF